ncbi:phycobilisome degradation protein NblB [Microseira sp. BLCC-F43]|jgi:HEAT repeat protein|uniref:phycobilisome degradation protein NblB n=1 Tax=Microseira sp. BLCC-F43 TaxID=3153602 RepID=UPI0035BB8782
MTITPESVRELLCSTNLGDRIRGVNHLRQLERAIAFELVQTAIKDSNPRIRYAAVSQLDSLGEQDLPTAYTILRDRLLNDPETDVQAAAADCLAALKLTDAFEDLRRIYQNTSEWLLQLSIIAALGVFGDPRCFDLLQEALNSSSDIVKTAAIGSLGELGDLRAIPLLVPYATDPDWQIRHRVAQALGHLGGEEARNTLETLATDEVELVAKEAQTYLPSKP